MTVSEPPRRKRQMEPPRRKRQTKPPRRARHHVKPLQFDVGVAAAGAPNEVAGALPFAMPGRSNVLMGFDDSAAAVVRVAATDTTFVDAGAGTGGASAADGCLCWPIPRLLAHAVVVQRQHAVPTLQLVEQGICLL